MCPEWDVSQSAAEKDELEFIATRDTIPFYMLTQTVYKGTWIPNALLYSFVDYTKYATGQKFKVSKIIQKHLKCQKIFFSNNAVVFYFTFLLRVLKKCSAKI